MRLLLQCFHICFGAALVLAVSSAQSNAHHNSAPRSPDIEGHQWHIGRSTNSDIDASRKWRGDAGKGRPAITLASGAIEGSPGCGRFNGAYRRSGNQLTISAGWTNDEKKPCNDKERESAANILQVLATVRQIHHEGPEYWLLDDENGTTQITLSLMQPGHDLSELEDSFWRLTQLEGSSADFADVIINIGAREVTFSNPSYQTSFPFNYKLAGLEFIPHYGLSAAAKDRALTPDEQTAKVFETVLHEIRAYEASADSVTFFGKGRQPIMVINSFPLRTIENRRWRIARYHGDSAQQADHDGLIDANEYAEVTFLNGRVRGSPGCGGWWGAYKLAGNQLTFDASLSLFGFCPPEDMTQDRLVENAFRAAVRIEEKSDHVLLRDKAGNVQILLVPY
jgi:heat shock protein HslJ